MKPWSVVRPGYESLLEPGEARGHGDAGACQHDHRGEEVGHVEAVGRLADELAEAGARAEELGDDDAVRLANSTSYGLAASVWTTNLARAHRVAARLESGIVWINCWMRRDLRTPFGGVKQSGVGREGGLEALRFFTEPKNVCIDIGTS